LRLVLWVQANELAPLGSRCWLAPDSNLRHRLRRAIRFVQKVQLVKPDAPELDLSSGQFDAVLSVSPH
jgi:hypothetical protein